MTQYVLSTMTNSVSYAFWDHPTPDLPIMREKITIRGGAGLPSLKNGTGEFTPDKEGTPMWTPSGVITPVADDKYERLKNHPLFKKHLTGGQVKLVNSDISGNSKAVAKEVRDMETRDGFAQLNPTTLKEYAKGVKINTESIDADVQFTR